MDETNEEVITKTDTIEKKVVEEKSKKKKVKKEKKTGLLAITCVAIGGKEKFKINITRDNVVTFGSYKKKGTIIRIKGVAVKYIANLSKKQYEELVKLYK